MSSSSENGPLLASGEDAPDATRPRKRVVSTFAILIILLGACLYVGIRGERHAPKNPLDRAKYYLSRSPVLDGHIDLPELARVYYGNNIDKFDLNKPTEGHLDIPRARAGHLGGFFWSTYVDCKKDGEDFLTPTNRVRDTLEQIDVARLMIDRYSDTFAYCETAQDVRDAIKNGKIASLLGIEGAHQLGNSLAVLRQLYTLGVRYSTLTHSCNNAFADSAGIFSPVTPAHGGLSALGRDLIYEMNRLGMLVDISHVSDNTAMQALDITRAPVIWSHSSARHFNNISRNVPDFVLKRIGMGRGKVDGVVMINIFPLFMSPTPETADVGTVADHVEYVANLIGKEHVGIGSDYDGIESVPKGMEDVSKYPELFAELIRRGHWSERDLAGLANQNVLRVLEGAEETARKMRKEGKKPSMAIYEKRTDLGRAHRVMDIVEDK